MVISQELGDQTPLLVGQMGIMQIAGALKGFLLRGGITIGEIVHDGECVFGPALNRAYELESQIAKYPRFVLDPDIKDELGNLGDLPVLEGGVWFLDPFRLEFIDFLKENHLSIGDTEVIEADLPAPENLLPMLPREFLLGQILSELKLQIRAPCRDKEWEKIAWLYDRIAPQLGVPRANSYPRSRLD